MPRKPKHCPGCKAGNIVPIEYGEPGPEMIEAYECGEIILGGCCKEEDQPYWHCKECDHEW